MSQTLDKTSASKKLGASRVFLLVSVFLTLYVVMLLWVFNPGVHVNDDIAMMSFANGEFTGRPEFQLVFIGPLVGFLLKSLYQLQASAPWYAIVLVSMQVFSSATLISGLYTSGGLRITRTVKCAFIIMVAYLPALILDISFSTTAMYCSAVGVVLTGMIFKNSIPIKPSWVSAPIAIFLLAGSLRFDFLVAANLLLLPYSLKCLPRLRSRRILFGLAVFVPLVALNQVEHSISNSGPWAGYHAFNNLRGSMHGTPSLSNFSASAYEQTTIQRIKKFGWESEDLVLFNNWFFENPKIYNTSTLGDLKKELNTNVTYLPIQNSFENLIFGREFLLLLSAIVVFYGTGVMLEKQMKFMLLQGLWFGAVALYISSRYRFPDRFALGAFFGFFISLLATNFLFESEARSQTKEHTRILTRLNAAVISVLVLFASLELPHKFSAREISKRNVSEAATYRQQLEMLDEIDSAGLFVSIGAQIIAEGINPWSEKTLLNGDRFLGLGWATYSPHQEKRKTQMGLSGNLIDALINQPHRYLLTTDPIAGLLQVSYERRMNTGLEFQKIRGMPYGTLFRVVQNK